MDTPMTPPSAPADNQPTSSVTDFAQNQAQQAQAQATPNTPQPVGQPGQPGNMATPAPRPRPTPTDVHQGLFRSILEGLGGGPVRVLRTNPETGESYMDVTHRKKADIGKSILAGAISGMLAGYTAPDAFDQFGHRSLAPSAQAGAEAGKAAAEKPSQQAQDLADTQLSRKFQILDHNLKLHAATLNNMKLQGEVFQKGVDDAKPVLDSMMLASQINPGLVKATHVSEADLQKMMQDGSAHVTRESVLPDGATQVYDDEGKPVMNPDGTPKMAYTYTVFDPSQMVQMSDELRKLDPNFAAIPKGQPVPARVFADAWRRGNELNAAQGFVDQWTDRANEVLGDKGKLKPIDIKQEIAKNPSLLRLIPALGKYAGLDPDQAMDEMRKDGVDPNVVGTFGKLFNVSKSDYAQVREAEKKRADLEGNPDKQPAEQPQIDLFKATLEDSIIPAREKNALRAALPSNPTQAQLKEVSERLNNLEQRQMDRDQRNAAKQDNKGEKEEQANDKSYQYHSTLLDKWSKPVDESVARFSRLMDTVNQMSPQADALIAPELLTVMAGGQGSGLRMNEAEIARVVGGRTKWEDLKAAVNKYQLDPSKGLSVTAEQRKEIRDLMNVVYKRLNVKQQLLSDARTDISDPDADKLKHRQTVANLRKKLDLLDNPRTVPNGKVPAYDKYGILVGYADDTTGKNAKYF